VKAMRCANNLLKEFSINVVYNIAKIKQ
jgi:hypothetical protein